MTEYKDIKSSFQKISPYIFWTSLEAPWLKNLPTNAGDRAQSLGWQVTLEKEMAAAVHLPGKSRGQRTLAGYSHGVTKELDKTQWINNNNNLVVICFKNKQLNQKGRILFSVIPLLSLSLFCCCFLIFTILFDCSQSQSWHVRYSSLTRDRNWASCIRIMESQPLREILQSLFSLHLLELILGLQS